MNFHWWRSHDAKNGVGLDIGPDSIKLLKINTTIKPFEVENFAIASLSPGAIIKGEIKNPSDLVGALKDVFKSSATKTKNVMLAIPKSSTIIKNISVDSRLNSAEIESRAWIEANRHFPELVGEIYLDFTIVGPSVQDPSQFELMMVACRKDQINPYLDVLHQAGLTAQGVDVNSFALERALRLALAKEMQAGTVAMLNIDYSLSTLIVAQEGRMIYAHDQSYDGHRLQNQFQDAIEQEKKSSAAEDKETLNQPEQTSAAEIGKEQKNDKQTTNVIKESFNAHLRHTMHFFYSSRPHINIQKIILAGDCANVPHLALHVQHEIGIETVVANPFSQMKIPSSVEAEKLRSYAPALMLCCGLALSDVDELK